MYKQFYAGMELIHLPLFALFLFLAAFVAVVVRTVLKRASDYEAIAQLPLEDTPRTRNE